MSAYHVGFRAGHFRLHAVLDFQVEHRLAWAEGMAGGYGPPSLIVNILNMVLSPERFKTPCTAASMRNGLSREGSKRQRVHGGQWLWAGEGVKQLLILSGLCIPLILLPKPLLFTIAKIAMVEGRAKIRWSYRI